MARVGAAILSGGGALTDTPDPADARTGSRRALQGSDATEPPLTVPVRTGVDHRTEFAEFMTTSGRSLGRLALLLTGDLHRADELLQQTLVRTYLAWSRARVGDPYSYARRVMANQRIDTWRRLRREHLTDPGELPERGATDEQDRYANHERLLTALRALPPRRRRVVVLRYLLDMPEAEVAAELGVSVGTVKSTAARGLTQLRTLLEEHHD